MYKATITLAKDLTDNAIEFNTMMEYASVVVNDNPMERKHKNGVKYELHNKYKERNRRKKVVK